MRERQIVNVAQPRAMIDTRNQSRRDQARYFMAGSPKEREEPKEEAPEPREPRTGFAAMLATHQGDISDLLDPGEADRIGLDAEREWRMDQATTEAWRRVTKEGLDLAAQEHDEREAGHVGPWEDAADIHYPILTTAALQFQARAYPELVQGDKAVGVKTFTPPAQGAVSQGGPPQNPAQAAQMQAQAQDQQTEAVQAKADQARAERIAHFLNWLIFYEMDGWEEETDLLLLEMPISGVGFKKVYFGSSGLCSEYVSALRLTVNNDTRSMARCPRITQDFDIYPNEIAAGRLSGRYRDIDLPNVGEDPEAPRLWIEQHRLEDLDGDGLPEPYIVTVDVETRQAMRIEAAYGEDDLKRDEDGGIVTIDRWQPFPAFRFLPDPRGRFYGLGLAKLLDSVSASVDASLNQLIDAGAAEVAGGGFIGANVRLQGTGQGGALWFRPGEYKTVSIDGRALQDAIWERTVPHPSDVTFQMLELLLAAAKDIASVKDVITGDAPSTAPVGTTLALQNQALQVFSSIYKRIYRGFREEFRLMFHALRRWGEARYGDRYRELTGGDFASDFAGDGTDVQPIADPAVVTKMQKISRIQTVVQLAETPVGMAAGMQQPGPAQALVIDALAALEIDRPERFVAAVQPNPELLAKVQELSAAAALKQAQAAHTGAKSALDEAKANRESALAVETIGKAGLQTHAIHQEADRVARQGLAPPPEELTPASAP